MDTTFVQVAKTRVPAEFPGKQAPTSSHAPGLWTGGPVQITPSSETPAATHPGRSF